MVFRLLRGFFYSDIIKERGFHEYGIGREGSKGFECRGAGYFISTVAKTISDKTFFRDENCVQDMYLCLKKAISTSHHEIL